MKKIFNESSKLKKLLLIKREFDNLRLLKESKFFLMDFGPFIETTSFSKKNGLKLKYHFSKKYSIFFTGISDKMFVIVPSLILIFFFLLMILLEKLFEINCNMISFINNCTHVFKPPR